MFSPRLLVANVVPDFLVLTARIVVVVNADLVAIVPF